MMGHAAPGLARSPAICSLLVQGIGWFLLAGKQASASDLHQYYPLQCAPGSYRSSALGFVGNRGECNCEIAP